MLYKKVIVKLRLKSVSEFIDLRMKRTVAGCRILDTGNEPKAFLKIQDQETGIKYPASGFQLTLYPMRGLNLQKVFSSAYFSPVRKNASMRTRRSRW